MKKKVCGWPVRFHTTKKKNVPESRCEWTKTLFQVASFWLCDSDQDPNKSFFISVDKPYKLGQNTNQCKQGRCESTLRKRALS